MANLKSSFRLAILCISSVYFSGVVFQTIKDSKYVYSCVLDFVYYNVI